MPCDMTEEGNHPAEATKHGSAATSFRIRRSWRVFRKSVLCVNFVEPRTPAELSRRANDVVLLGRVYYVFVAYLIGTARDPFGDVYAGGTPTAPLWPIRLVDQIAGTDWLRHETALMATGLLLALGAAAAPHVVVLRLGAFLHLMLHVAMRSSYGSINHGAHILLLVGFALLFLPGRRRGRRHELARVRSCLTALWMAQTVILLSYALAGVWKILLARFEIFTSDALTRILLERLLSETDEVPPLLPLVAQHNWLAQSMWWLTLYIEIFALLVVFRPHLHRPFGAALMLFHIMSDLILNIAFSLNIVMLGLFLLLSPLAPDRFSLSGTVRSLPIVGVPFRVLKRRRSSHLP